MTSLTYTPTANETLMGAEAEARSKFEACVAGTCECLTHGAPSSDGRIAYSYQFGFIRADGITFVIGYHGEPVEGVRERWRWHYMEVEGGLCGAFDSRASCLSSLEAHLAAVQG